jgi:glycosyltransferase involved in cell wall biosynthesis
MRIAVFGIRGIPSTYSGYETFATAALPMLAERGHSITLFCRRQGQPEGPFLGVERITTRSIQTKGLDTITHGMGCSIRITPARYDVALAFNVVNSPMVRIVTGRGVPTVLNVDGQEWLRGKWGALASGVFRRTARYVRRSGSAVVTDCRAMRQTYLREFATDSTVIPYFSAVPSEPDYRAISAHGLSRYGYYVTGGRLVPENNIHLIAESYLRCTDPRPLIVLGKANYDSPVTRRIQQLAASDERIRLLGHIEDRASYAGLMAGAITYFHGHSVGGINPSLVEAMACGTNISALRTAFNQEALGDCGLYFDDPRQAASQTLDQPDHTSDASSLRRTRASTRAASTFRSSDIVTAYETLLLRAAAGDSTPMPTVWNMDVGCSSPVGQP